MGKTRRGQKTRRSSLKSKGDHLQKKKKEATMDIHSSNSSTTTSFDGSPKSERIDFECIDVSSHGCSTPKGERFRIPEIRTCPPAPKKRRLVLNCSSERSPIAFFAPPDIELFFFCALRDTVGGVWCVWADADIIRNPMEKALVRVVIILSTDDNLFDFFLLANSKQTLLTDALHFIQERLVWMPPVKSGMDALKSIPVHWAV
ncbi:hypothetical protein RJ641_034169 [Dillenia turbinata]|uniref:Uncharacterized protein n=1 Tax=Dillenia turbinata TaxID=194707 RepID=A0AAN8ZDZ5_9MAGN